MGRAGGEPDAWRQRPHKNLDRARRGPDGGCAMPRKPGPRRIDPETFVPAVFTVVGSDHSILVCRRRWLRGPDALGGPPEAVVSSAFFSFPVAIELSTEEQVLTGYTTRDLSFTCTRPEDHGISTRCARIALAEAWHAVGVTLDPATMSAHASCRLDEWVAHKNGVRIRNLAAALAWDRWNLEGLDLEARVARLDACGYRCTVRQLARFMDDHGLRLGKTA